MLYVWASRCTPICVLDLSRVLGRSEGSVVPEICLLIVLSLLSICVSLMYEYRFTCVKRVCVAPSMMRGAIGRHVHRSKRTRREEMMLAGSLLSLILLGRLSP